MATKKPSARAKTTRETTPRARRAQRARPQLSKEQSPKEKPSKGNSPKAQSPKGAKPAQGPEASASRQPERAPSAKRARARAPKPGPAQASKAPPSKRPASKRAPREESPHSTILVTGIVGRMGQLLTRLIHADHRVIGIDRRPFENRPKDVTHHAIDIRRKKTRDVFRSAKIDAVVHLGVLHDPRASDRERHHWNVVAFDKLTQYCGEFEVPKLVVLSSANVYGPHPENSQFLTEEAPLLGSQEFRAMRDLVELDMLAQGFFWKRPETETVILRPVHILGRVHNAASNYLRLERPITLLGYDPMVQVIHERDVAAALALALRPGVRGIFNLKGRGELPLSRLIKMAGQEPMRLPSFAAKAIVERMWKLRMTSFPSPELDFIRYVCMVDDQRAQEVLGFQPRYTLEQAVAAVHSLR